MRQLGIDVEACPRCGGKMKVIALVQDPQGIARYLRHLGLPTEAPSMAPARGPAIDMGTLMLPHAQEQSCWSLFDQRATRFVCQK